MSDATEIKRRGVAAVRSKNTKPEMAVRRMLHAQGYRYRLHRTDLPGSPDLVFPSRKKVIFVNGCFWHGHSCKNGSRRPPSNTSYWLPKIARNVERDAKNISSLEVLGWQSLTVWECELKRSPEELRSRITRFLG
ncbi:MAG: very short patch repair endonuclease [bacterium]|nr:very short patch repair endonuclease [bacterium]